MGQPTGHSEAPRWYVAAMGRHVVRSSIEVAGAEIAYAVWPSSSPASGDPGLLLIHGTYANQYWWDHIAGQLDRARQVVAIDLSGHGDSGHRDTYELAIWADEVRAVLAATGLDRRPAHVVGHSLGGVVAAVAATDGSSPIRSVAMCESIRDPQAARHPLMVPRARRVYPDRASALARFRTIPPGVETVPYVVGYVAAKSIAQVDGGWTWKHDLNVGSDVQPKMPRLDQVIASVTCPMAVMVGEHGLVDARDVEMMMSAGAGRLRAARIPTAGHHLPLEAPQGFATAIERFVDEVESLTTR